MDKTKIGFVGLGLMGGAMAKNLLAAGYPVIGYDIDGEKSAEIAKAGANIAQDLETLPAQVDVIILSLPNSSVVDEVVINGLKLLAAPRKELILIWHRW